MSEWRPQQSDTRTAPGDTMDSMRRDGGSGSFDTGVPTGSNAPELHTMPEQQQKEHGIMRQILNPGGEKYSEQSFGETATTNNNASGAGLGQGGQDTGKKEHGILRQIFNPGGDKYDPAQYQGGDDALAKPVSEGQRIPGALGTGDQAKPVHSGEAAEDKHGILRQLVNPGGQNYDEMRYEPTGDVGSGKPTQQSHAGRDAAIAGTAGAGTGVLAHEANRDRSGHEQAANQGPYHAQQLGSSNTQQAYSGVPSSGYQQDLSRGQTAQQPYSTPQSTQQPHSTSQQQYSSSQSAYSHDPNVVSSERAGNHHGAEAALGGAALGAGGIAAYEHNQHARNTGLNDPSTSAPVSGQAHPDLASSRQTQPAGHGHSTQAQPGLTHHVYNSVTEAHPSTTGQRDFSKPSSHAQAQTSSAPVFHPHAPAYTGSNDFGSSGGKVYNTVAGKHSEAYEHEPHHHQHSGAAAPLGAAALGGAAASSAPAQSNHGGQTYGSNTLPSHERAAQGNPLSSSQAAGSSSMPSYAQSSGAQQYGSSSVPSQAQPSGQQQYSSSVPGQAQSSGQQQYGSSSVPSQVQQPAQQYTQPSATGTTSHDRSAQPGHNHNAAYAGAGAVGGTAAAALAAQQAMKRHENVQGGQQYSPYSGNTQSAHDPTMGSAVTGAPGLQSSSTGPASKTIGPHDSNIANVMDPRVQPHSEQMKSSTTAGPHKSDMLNKLDPRVQSDPAKAGQQQSHTGRDAALGAGSGAAIGAGAYESQKHHSEHAGSSSGARDTTSDTHKPGLFTRLGLKHDDRESTGHGHAGHGSKHDGRETSGHGHAGRDAAIVGGTGAAGIGAYEAEKHHHQQQTQSSSAPLASQQQQRPSASMPHAAQQQQTPSTSMPYSAQQQQPSTVGGPGPMQQQSMPQAQQREQSMPSSAPYAGQQHQSQPDAATGTTQSQNTHPSVQQQQGIADNTTRNDNQHGHAGRDAALLGGGAAAVGAGAYEANKHHQHGQHQSSEPQKEGLLSKLGLKSDDKDKGTFQHGHAGRDAAVVGGTGAAGVGAYEAEKHHSEKHHSDKHHADKHQSKHASHSSSKDTSEPPKQGLLSKLGLKSDKKEHEHDRKHEHEHAGRNTALAGGAAAAGGAGVYEAEKHHHAHDQQRAGNNTSSNIPSSHEHSTQSPHHQAGQSHLGRDAAVAGGAGALGGAGIYEAERHHHQHGQPQMSSQQQMPGQQMPSTTMGGAQYPPGQSAGKGDFRGQDSQHPVQSQQHHAHAGRDAALAGGAGGVAGAGLYEAEKHHHNNHPGAMGHRSEQTQMPSNQYATQPQHMQGAPGSQSTPMHPSGTQHQSHTGRDAALGGASGVAAGTGLYEAEKHHQHGGAAGQAAQSGQGYPQTSGPASKTVGPHESNIANVLDPRVQPQPQHMKEHTTSGPHQSDTLNKLDPRVNANEGQATQHSHQGRDLAAGAGAGAGAGAAAHEAHEHKKHSGPMVREDEHHHNKLHKEPKEKKEGFISKLLHGGKKDKDGNDGSGSGRSSTDVPEHQRGSAGFSAQHHPSALAAGTAGIASQQQPSAGLASQQHPSTGFSDQQHPSAGIPHHQQPPADHAQQQWTSTGYPEHQQPYMGAGGDQTGMTQHPSGVIDPHAGPAKGIEQYGSGMGAQNPSSYQTGGQTQGGGLGDAARQNAPY